MKRNIHWPACVFRLVSAVCCLSLLMAGLPGPAAAQSSIVARLQQMGGYPCPNSSFTCIDVQVPLDHFGPSPYTSQTIDVVFAVLPATGVRKGMFVTANGGPGVSGLLSADSYTALFDPSIPEHFDVVFFDQRGIGKSGGFQCTDAIAQYYQVDQRAQTPGQEAALIAAAQAFAPLCASKLGPADRLPFYGTRQAVEDLDTFRQLIGDKLFWLYGESYGTEFSQAYAAAHPDHLGGLVLDGTVDLTLSGVEFLKGSARAFNDTLVKTLRACDKTKDCSSDFGRDPVQAYDDLSTQLQQAPHSLKFPLANGHHAARQFSFADLEVVAGGQMYNESDRMIFQRAMAYAARDGDLGQLTRLLYITLNLDESTLAAQVNLDYSDAAYYAINCNDYPYFNGTGTPLERAQKYLRYGDQVDANVPRLRSIFYGDLPCVFWPSAHPNLVPLDSTAARNVPTLVLGATADPATPVFNGRRVFGRLKNAHLVTTQGGPHVIFGRGRACPDNLVTAFLVDGIVPDKQKIVCKGVVVDAYVPIAPRQAREFDNPLVALSSAETEISYLPEYYYWGGAAPRSTGCPQEGTLSFEQPGADIAFTLVSCAFTKGFVMAGTGSYNAGADRFTLEVALSGYKSGDLHYVRVGDQMTVTGTYGGKPILLHK